MERITTAAELKNAILQLEYESAVKHAAVEGHFFTVCESLKPINIINNSIKEAHSIDSDLKTNAVNSIIGFISGIAMKKIFVGKSHSPLKLLLGAMLERFIAKQVSKNADGIKVIANTIIEKAAKTEER